MTSLPAASFLLELEPEPGARDENALVTAELGQSELCVERLDQSLFSDAGRREKCGILTLAPFEEM